MSATIVHLGSKITVQSPYNKDFAWAARTAGGTWNRVTRVWEFQTTWQIESLQNLVQRFYPEAVVADANPVPVALPPAPDLGYYGRVGDMVTLDLEITKTVDFVGKYGATRLHCMRDNNGRVFTWYAASARMETGTTVRLVGRIKAHNPYKGTSQTVLTRCKKI